MIFYKLQCFCRGSFFFYFHYMLIVCILLYSILVYSSALIKTHSLTLLLSCPCYVVIIIIMKGCGMKSQKEIILKPVVPELDRCLVILLPLIFFQDGVCHIDLFGRLCMSCGFGSSLIILL